MSSSSFPRRRETGGLARWYRTTPDSQRRATGLAMALLVASLSASLFAGSAGAKEAQPESPDPVLEARMVRITSELRCLVCQNQTIADSHADLAVDLRREARELLSQGKSDQDVIDYMTARYGDFVLYRPPLKATTLLLWGGPALMLLIGAGVGIATIARRNRMTDEAFEPEDDEARERARA